jgi:hypothetical protein|tara:strand:+ start:2176 stop:2832 length:657 start_codon:yes stop_codon:yes gene_type:complete
MNGNSSSPIDFTSFLSRISGAMGGQGMLWQGQQQGLTNEAMRAFAGRQAQRAARASSGLGLSNVFGKGLGLLGMALMPQAAPLWQKMLLGGVIAGGVSGVGGKWATDKLRKEDVADYMPGGEDVLYGRQQAADVESDALSAITQLQQSWLPKAVGTAVQTPLTYATMQTMKNPYLSTTAKSAYSPEVQALREAYQQQLPSFGTNTNTMDNLFSYYMNR